jgi:rubredoxin
MRRAAYNQKGREGKRRNEMEKWRCVCSYVYDPEKGDPANGVDPGTPWEKVPDDWTCPLCGQSKDVFEKV